MGTATDRFIEQHLRRRSVDYSSNQPFDCGDEIVIQLVANSKNTKQLENYQPRKAAQPCRFPVKDCNDAGI